MKKVGIIFAMKEELDAFLKYLPIVKKYKIFDLDFYEGELYSLSCVLVESGIGKVNAARTTQILIDNMKVDYIFNIGVAGGVSSALQVGDIVIGKNLVQHDFDLTGFQHEKGYIPKVGKFIDCDFYLYQLAISTLKELEEKNTYHIVSGTIASGDIFCTDPEMAEKIHTKFGAECVEMEGASIAQVCFLTGIPFLILRSISDTPNHDNVITYSQFLKQSSFHIADMMDKILFQLAKDEL